MKTVLRGHLAVTVLAIGAAIAWLLFAPPLLSSDDYMTTATLNGEPTDVTLFRPLLMSRLYYVHIPDAQPRRYRWFGVAFSRTVTFSPSSIRTGWRGIHYIHRDEATGVDLLFSKIEDDWEVHFLPDGVQFSNGSLTVLMKKS